MARIKRNVLEGATTIKVRPSALDGQAPYLAKLGTELVNVLSQLGDTLTLEAAVAEPHGAGGYLVEITIKITVGTGPVDESAVARLLHHTEASPEGEVEAVWEILTRSPADYTPDMDANPTSFLLWSNETGTWVPFFGGHIGRVADSQGPNGFHKLTLTGRGQYITAGWLPYGVSHVWPADTAGHVVIEDALGSMATWISSSHDHILDGGLQIGQELDGIGKTTRDLLNYVISRDDGSGPLDWYVRTDTDGASKLWLILRSRNPTIEIPISSLKAPVEFYEDYQDRVTMVQVKFSSGYVDAVPDGATGAVRGRYFDYSTQIDNEPLARQVAQLLANNLGILQSISEGQVVVEFPKVVLKDGDPFPLHLVKAGWYVSFTGWEGGFELTTEQIKGLTADHIGHTLSLNVGKIEDDLAIGEQYFGKQTKLQGSPVSGLIPLNIAPPEGMPYSVKSAAASTGANGQFGWGKTAPEADITESTYNIASADGVTTIVAGRKFPEDRIHIGGRLLGFRMTGNDGVEPTPGPGTIKVEVYRGHDADLPAIGTLVTSIEISAGVKAVKDLDEPPAATDVIIDLEPGDYLVYKVVDDPPVDAITNCAITRVIQRTGGSDREVHGGSPSIVTEGASRDSATGIVTFTVEMSKHCRVQIEYGKTNSYGSFSKVSEIIKKTTEIQVTLDTPFHWRTLARDDDGHLVVGTDQTG